MSKSFLNNHLSRGLRNNNPGNIKRTADNWKGKIPFSQSKDQVFEQFDKLENGIRALIKDLTTKITNGTNTVHKIITKYAPPGVDGNPKTAYIDFVASRMGISKNDVLDSSNINVFFLAQAICEFELGSTHYKNITHEDFNAGMRAAGRSDVLGDVTVSKKRCELCGHILLIVVAFFFSSCAILL